MQINGYYGPLVFASSKPMVVGSTHQSCDEKGNDLPFYVVREATAEEFYTSAAEINGAPLIDDYKARILKTAPYFYEVHTD